MVHHRGLFLSDATRNIFREPPPAAEQQHGAPAQGEADPTSWMGPEVVIHPVIPPGAMPDGQRQKSLNRFGDSSV
jgi:hypothetical protein